MNPIVLAEYDRENGNTIILNSIPTGDFVKHKESKPTMKVIFKFPAKSEGDEKIKKEINSIMSSVLQEQLKKQ